jgi:carboxylate-amine ligase
MEHAYGTGDAFSVGIEEELLLVEGDDCRLSHSSAAVLEAMGLDQARARHDLYAAQVELSSPPCRTPAEATRHLEELRGHVAATGATAIGSGLHPTAELGDVRIVDAERYLREAGNLRGIVRRTPDCALHVHVGMPDLDAALRACNGLREHLPLLEALAANSPYWHGLDSQLASARRTLRRGYPRVSIPPAFAGIDGYRFALAASLEAAGLDDYTLVWWEVRPHPRLGTIEVRTMDSQSSLGAVAGIAALVQGLAAHYSEDNRPRMSPGEGLEESSFRAARDGIEATLHEPGGGFRPVRDMAREAIEKARPHARELGSDRELEEVERLLRDGGGAARRRAAFERGAMSGVLDDLVEETQKPAGFAR